MISDFEQHAELAEDLMADLCDEWRDIIEASITPRTLARIEATLVQLHRTADALRDLRVEMDRLVKSARQVVA